MKHFLIIIFFEEDFYFETVYVEANDLKNALDKWIDTTIFPEEGIIFHNVNDYLEVFDERYVISIYDLELKKQIFHNPTLPNNFVLNLDRQIGG